jgi:DNA-binding NarL/FixJ family response regulator
MTRSRILMADDHRMVAEGLRGVLEPTYELVDIVADGRQLVEAAQRLQPDVIVADISMPQLNGLDAVVQMRRDGCQAKIVFLTMHCDALYAVRAMRAGASAYVLKQSASTELLTAIRMWPLRSRTSWHGR